MKTKLILTILLLSIAGSIQADLPKNKEVEKPNYDIHGSVVRPRVYFIEPKDGQTVSEEFVVKMGVEGIKLEKAGVATPGSGHHHLIVDGKPVAAGEVVPKDEKHIHFGDASNTTKLKLSKGPHTLTLQFADGAHKSYGEKLSQTIHVNVELAP